MDVSILDPYVTLEVSPRASASVIKAAYHALSKEGHPDTNADDDLNTMVDRAKALNLAYATLSDPKKRAAFDKKTGGGTIIGSYKVLEQIAEGGFGTTYKGEHSITKSPVCIKHCSEVSAAHDAVLINEAKAIWDLRHYALPVMRSMERLEDNSLALIMSYIEGPTLEQVCEKAGKLDAETVSWITERILNALLYLHHHGVVHGDIKPQNIILQAQQHQAVLVDFGLAMVKPTASSKPAGHTPVYAPPEQIAGKPLLPASDFYSLGMVMLYLLSGGDMGAVERRDVPSNVPDPICAFIKNLTKRNVLLRPQSTSDLFEELQKTREQAFKRRRSGMKPVEGL